MKTHDIKRIFKIAQKFDRVCIEYQTETHHSWKDCGKLTAFEVIRDPYALEVNQWYRRTDIKLVFDNTRVQWAFCLERFADRKNNSTEDFIGLVGTGFENQYVYLRVIPIAHIV